MTSELMSAAEALERDAIERGMAELIVADRVKLWAYPDVAIRLGQVISRKNVSLAEISRFVSADSALAGAVLRMANTATYRGSGGEIRRVLDAVGRLGLQAVVFVAVAAGLGKDVCSPGPLQPLRFRAWRWSVSTAVLCQELATRRSIDSGVAFLGGLMRSFGRSVALSALEQLLESRGSSISLPSEVWHSMVESRQRRFGALVAQRWQLPPLVNAVLIDDDARRHGGVADDSSDHGGVASAGLVELCRLADRVVATVELCAEVTPDELRSMSGFLDEEELQHVVTIVERLPWAIEALLEMPAVSVATMRPRAITFPASSLQGALRPVDFSVVNAKAQGSTEYRATHVANDGIVLSGKTPMQLDHVVQLELHRGDTPLLAWVRVSQCERTDNGYRIEVKPYAQGRDNRARWSDAMDDREPLEPS